MKGKRINVLDKGFVELVDFMGSDQSIVDSARVSVSGDGVKPTSDNRQLIRYLFRHRHSTPQESVVFTFAIKAPILTIRQWHRHRTACLTSDTVISFNRPCDGKHYPKTLGDVYELYCSNPSQLQKMQLRCFDESQKKLITTTVKKVWSTGVNPVYSVLTTSGKVIKATENHKFLTDSGWQELRDIEVGDKLLTYQQKAREDSTNKEIEFTSEEVNKETWCDIKDYEGRYQISSLGRVLSFLNNREHVRSRPRLKNPTINTVGYPVVSLSKNGITKVFTIHGLVADAFLNSFEVNGRREICHNDGNKLNNRLSNLKVGTSQDNSNDLKTHGRQAIYDIFEDSIVSITLDGNEETFDMEVEGPWHNFIANGIVVHNSYNEMSARYGVLPDDFYIPELTRMNAQAKKNHQGSDEAIIDEANVNRTKIEKFSALAYEVYQDLLSTGLAKELARSVLPVNIYTKMYCTVNLHNLFHFLKLRMDDHAQHEIRVYADAMLELIRDIVPEAVQAFEDYSMNGVYLNSMEVKLFKKIVDDRAMFDLCTQSDLIDTLGTKREVEEFQAKLIKLSKGGL